MANVLNKVPGVVVNGEIPDFIMHRAIRVIKLCDRYYGKKNGQGVKNNWDHKKREYMFASWAGLSKGKVENYDSQCLFYGYKTPFHERYFDFYNKFFHPVHPKYICCVRSFPDHLLSVQARWPKRIMPYIALRYIMSLRQLRYMKMKASDHVFFFFLDDYKVSGTGYLQQRIFEPLGLVDVAGAIRKAEQGPVNTSAQRGVNKKDSLSRIQELLLKICPKPFIEFESLRRDFD